MMTEIKPDFVQNDIMQFIYLAIVISTLRDSSYIFYLGLRRDGKGGYPLQLVTNVETYSNIETAKLVCATKKRIMKYQHNSEFVKGLLDTYKVAIDNFKQNVRQSEKC